MKTFLRVAITLLTFISTQFFVYWVGGGLLLEMGAPFWIGSVASLVAGVAAAAFVWIGLGSAPGALTYVALGALMTGAIAFAGGFFGPLILSPEANQGPLLGLLITGPVGFVAGGLGGGVLWWLRHGKVRGG